MRSNIYLKYFLLLFCICIVEIFIYQWISQFQFFKRISPFLFLLSTGLSSLIIILVVANLWVLKNKLIKWVLYVFLGVSFGMLAYALASFYSKVYLFGLYDYKMFYKFLTDPMSVLVLSLVTGVWLQFLSLAYLYEVFLTDFIKTK